MFRSSLFKVYFLKIQWNSATAPISFKKPPRSLKIALNRKKISRSGRSKIVKSSLIWCATRQVDNEKNINFCVARFVPGNILRS